MAQHGALVVTAEVRLQTAGHLERASGSPLMGAATLNPQRPQEHPRLADFRCPGTRGRTGLVIPAMPMDARRSPPSTIRATDSSPTAGSPPTRGTRSV